MTRAIFPVVACLILIGFQQATSQPVQAGSEIVGTWVSRAKSGENDQYWTIRNANGKWTVQGVYKTDNMETGSFVGEGVEFDGKMLSYTHKYIKKPAKGADNVAVTITSAGDQLRYSWTVNNVVKTKLLDRVAEIAKEKPKEDPKVPKKDPKEVAKENPKKTDPGNDLDAAGQKLLGTHAARVDRMFTILSVNYEQGAWSVSGLFKENGRDVGGFEGTDFQYDKGVLTFKQKFFLKPQKDWKDDEKFTLRIAGNKVVGLPDRAGALIRSFERIDIPASASPELKKDDPRRFVGVYRGTANDGTRGMLVIAESGGNLAYHATWYNAEGRVVGVTIGTDISAVNGNLQMVQRHLKKPSPTWHDNAIVRLELVQNALTQTRQDGNRWSPSASFTRAER